MVVGSWTNDASRRYEMRTNPYATLTLFIRQLTSYHGSGQRDQQRNPRESSILPCMPSWSTRVRIRVLEHGTRGTYTCTVHVYGPFFGCCSPLTSATATTTVKQETSSTVTPAFAPRRLHPAGRTGQPTRRHHGTDRRRLRHDAPTARPRPDRQVQTFFFPPFNTSSFFFCLLLRTHLPSAS
jgi:hypothetical protein